MAKYTIKPVLIDAIQWTGNNATEVANFVYDSYYFSNFNRVTNEKDLVILTPYGHTKADIGDYIIKSSKGDLSVCNAEIFKAMYMPVTHEAILLK